jgi:hypothetical protein
VCVCGWICCYKKKRGEIFALVGCCKSIKTEKYTQWRLKNLYAFVARAG